jgi:hypothetical protein
MTLQRRSTQVETLSPRIGDPQHAQRFTVNLSAEIANELRGIAGRYRVSETSVVEVALRHLFRRVTPAAFGGFLRDRGACLRRNGARLAKRG